MNLPETAIADDVRSFVDKPKCGRGCKLSKASFEIEQKAFWPFAAACVAALIALNWSWHAWAHQIAGSQELYIIIGSIAYFALLRWLIGIRFLDLSRETRFVVFSSTVLLLLLLSFGRTDTYHRFFGPLFPSAARNPLLGFVYFAACSVVLRFVIPYLLVRFKLRRSPREYGYALQGTTRTSWIFFGLFVATVPPVLWASTLPAFQSSYPQSRGVVVGNEVSTELFFLYHAAYFMVFLSGESFWRGYMTFGLARDLGVTALPWMVMLYSMGHYGKPFLEVNASIIAGFVLGYLALRHGSFLFGALLHWSIALTMDLAVLWQLGVTWH